MWFQYLIIYLDILDLYYQGMGVPVTGDNTWRDGDTAAVDDVDTKVPLYIYTHYIHIQPLHTYTARSSHMPYTFTSYTPTDLIRRCSREGVDT